MDKEVYFIAREVDPHTRKREKKFHKDIIQHYLPSNIHIYDWNVV